MAAPRKSAQQVAARERARAKAQELTERHERLIDLAAEFFEQEQQAEQIRAEARERADAILAKAEQDAEAAAKEAGAKARQMLGTGESKAAVAARLGLTATELKRHVGASPATPGDSVVQSAEPVDEQSAVNPKTAA